MEYLGPPGPICAFSAVGIMNSSTNRNENQPWPCPPASAVELFYENGYQNTTLEMVADRLGVTKPFIYAHFNSKSELLAEICSRGIASSIEAINGVMPLRVPPTEKLRLLGERFVTAVLGSQMHIAIF